ncbi:MAG: azurin [Bacteroidota bacterium]
MKYSIIILFIGCLIASCNSEPKQSNNKLAPPKEQKKAPKKGEEVTIELGAGDDMQYDTKLIKVKEGQVITVNLTHKGVMEEKMMGHNFVLLKQYTDVADFAAKATAAHENEYIPKSDNIIAYTEMIGGGESTSVTFDAPEKGVYDFICSFPGHYGLMNGKLIVQ